MVEPVGFVEAWRAQFPESDPPYMDLNSMGDIEQELDKCKESIRHLEKEVNKERFRMIYLQTLLAKERKSYDGQRWGFSRTPQANDRGPSDGAAAAPQQKRAPLKAARCQAHPEAEADGGLAAQHKSGLSPAGQGFDTPDIPVGTGSVAALRSNFERIRRVNSQGAADSRGLSVLGGQEKPFYVNMEYHQERGLVKVNDREVSDKISTLGSQAMQMERKRSLHSVPVNLSAATGGMGRVVQRGRSAEGNCGHNGSYDDLGVGPHFLNDGVLRRPERQAPECQPYTSVYVGAMMADVDTRVTHAGGRSPEDDLHHTWPGPSCSPASLDEMEGGYTPDCSSNENLTSSEEAFSSGPSSHVSPSPTTCPTFTEKSRSPSQHSWESGSPPTPLSQKRLKQQSEAAVIGVCGSGPIWPSDGDSTASSRTSQDSSLPGALGTCSRWCFSAG